MPNRFAVFDKVVLQNLQEVIYTNQLKFWTILSTYHTSLRSRRSSSAQKFSTVHTKNRQRCETLTCSHPAHHVTRRMWMTRWILFTVIDRWYANHEPPFLRSPPEPTTQETTLYLQIIKRLLRRGREPNWQLRPAPHFFARSKNSNICAFSPLSQLKVAHFMQTSPFNTHFFSHLFVPRQVWPVLPRISLNLEIIECANAHIRLRLAKK